MKNTINFYYNLIIDEFRKNKDYFIFNIQKNKYIFFPYYGDQNSLYNMYLIIKSLNRYTHEIILNKDRKIITYYKDMPYILLKKERDINNKLNIENITNYDSLVYGKHTINWKKLWEEKIDYYEYQMSQIGIKYKVLKDSFNYYVGLSETAISLLNYLNREDIKFYISHKRIEEDFYNPINIIIDSRVRDISEYIKLNYINDKINNDEVINYIKIMNFSYNEIILFLSRLIYPSYYFDLYDKVIQENMNEDKIKLYIKKNVYYETFLKSIYKYIKSIYQIPQIEWLESI